MTFFAFTELPSKPLIRFVSDERIQGNPRKSKPFSREECRLPKSCKEYQIGLADCNSQAGARLSMHEGRRCSRARRAVSDRAYKLPRAPAVLAHEHSLAWELLFLFFPFISPVTT